VHAPVGELDRQPRVGHVDQAEVAAPHPVPPPARRAGLAVLAGRHARVDEGAAQVAAVLDLQLVQPARAAAGAQEADLGGPRRIRHVEDLEAAEDARVGAVAAAHLDADDRDVAAGERAVARLEDHDVLGRGGERAGERGDAARSRRIGRVHDGDAVVGAEPLLGARRVVGEAPRPDVGVLLVHPDVGVVAATAEVVVPDGDHVARGALGLGARGIDPVDLRRRRGIVTPCRDRDAQRCRHRGDEPDPLHAASLLRLPAHARGSAPRLSMAAADARRVRRSPRRPAAAAA
jgi:hypothetical protein